MGQTAILAFLPAQAFDMIAAPSTFFTVPSGIYCCQDFYMMSSSSPFSKNAAEFYDFTNLHELRNACYNLPVKKIVDYANQADADEIISLLVVLEGNKRVEFINGLHLNMMAEAAEDLHASELNELLEQLPAAKRDRLMHRLSDQVLYQLSKHNDNS